jgi:hypothetical protein
MFNGMYQSWIKIFGGISDACGEIKQHRGRPHPSVNFLTMVACIMCLYAQAIAADNSATTRALDADQIDFLRLAATQGEYMKLLGDYVIPILDLPEESRVRAKEHLDKFVKHCDDISRRIRNGQKLDEQVFEGVLLSPRDILKDVLSSRQGVALYEVLEDAPKWQLFEIYAELSGKYAIAETPSDAMTIKTIQTRIFETVPQIGMNKFSTTEEKKAAIAIMEKLVHELEQDDAADNRQYDSSLKVKVQAKLKKIMESWRTGRNN